MSLPYKRNHTIPRCMLNYWVDSTGNYPGVHIYDIREKRSYKSASGRKRAFSFAIENELHIVDAGSKRATSLERWLSSLESTLCYILKLAHSRSTIELDSNEEFRAAIALQSLESRSRYELHQIQQYISQNQQNKSTGLKKLSLENFIDYVTTMARNFILWN